MFSRDVCASNAEPAEHGSSNQSRLTREQVVDRIIHINPTATTRFLDQFNKPSLEAYLAHLDHARQPRGRLAVWTRPVGVPAITGRAAAP